MAGYGGKEIRKERGINHIRARSAKYSSRDIPAVLISFLMMNTGTEDQSGITTGLGTPCFVYTK